MTPEDLTTWSRAVLYAVDDVCHERTDGPTRLASVEVVLGRMVADMERQIPGPPVHRKGYERDQFEVVCLCGRASRSHGLSGVCAGCGREWRAELGNA